jgi:hypothetical protein
LSPTCEPDPGNAGGGIAILRLRSHPDQGGFFCFLYRKGRKARKDFSLFFASSALFVVRFFGAKRWRC